MDEQNGQTPANPPSDPNPDLAGYPSVDALVAGYRASGNEAKKWRDQATLLEQQLMRQHQPQQVRSQDPYQQLQDYGIPPDALQAAVQQTVAQAFEPIARGFAARNQVLVKHPDYTKFEPDVMQHVASDPDLNQSYQRMFDADPAGAMEYAYLKFGESRRGQKTPKSEPPPSADAQIPSGRSGDGRRGADVQNQNMRDLYEHGQKTGNYVPFIKERLKQVIPDSFLNQG